MKGTSRIDSPRGAVWAWASNAGAAHARTMTTHAVLVRWLLITPRGISRTALHVGFNSQLPNSWTAVAVGSWRLEVDAFFRSCRLVQRDNQKDDHEQRDDDRGCRDGYFRLPARERLFRLPRLGSQHAKLLSVDGSDGAFGTT